MKLTPLRFPCNPERVYTLDLGNGNVATYTGAVLNEAAQIFAELREARARYYASFSLTDKQTFLHANRCLAALLPDPNDDAFIKLAIGGPEYQDWYDEDHLFQDVEDNVNFYLE
jgi:hypothetical protein